MHDRLDHLIRLAQDDAGIEDHYWDMSGRRHETTIEAASSLLGGLGYDVSSADSLQSSLDTKLAARDSRWLPETLVVSVGQQPLRLPIRESTGAAPYLLHITLEDGSEIHWASDPVVPRTLPLGYHWLTIANGPRVEQGHLVVCPDRAFLPPASNADRKFAGLGVFLPGVRDAKTWGCGDFRALGDLAEWAAQELGAAYIALNPLHAIHNRSPYNTSPYLPNSVLYRNFIYLDIGTLPDFEADLLLKTPRVQAEIARLNASELVDYECVARLKRTFLLHAFRSFWRQHWLKNTPHATAFRAYIAAEGEALRRHAIHCALDEHFHRLNKDVWNWPQWPTAYQDPASSETQAFALEHPRTLLFHQYTQWQIDAQAAQAQHRAKAAGMPIGLFHDLPLATDRFGAELWSHRQFYLAKGGVGAPPDALGPEGQDWGFPPPNRDAHRADGYRHFAHTIRASARHGGAIRIDHVMRLFRLYCIPEGKTAMDGVYVRDYAEDLLKVLALESVRNQLIIIGEDLGTVSDGVRESLGAMGVLSYRLLYFERTTETEFRLPAEYPRQALVSTTTHDLPTVAGYWQSRDINLRHEAGLITSNEAFQAELQARQVSKQGILNALFAADLLPANFSHNAADYAELTGELHNAIIGFLASTPSMLLTVNQEDLTKDLEQQNLPGTVHQHPNWRRKMRLTLEQLKAETAYALMLKNWIERTGRAGN